MTAIDRALRREGRHLFARRLPSALTPPRRRVLTLAVTGALVLVAGVAIPGGIALVGPVRGLVAGLSAAVAATGLAVSVVGRVCLVSDVRRLVEPSWAHDGILERHTGPAATPVSGDLVAPLRQAAEAAAVRATWAVVIGAGQCVLGAGALAGGALLLPRTPWIVLLAAFIVGGHGQDAAARALRRLAVAAAASRVADAVPRSDQTTPGETVPPSARPGGSARPADSMRSTRSTGGMGSTRTARADAGTDKPVGRGSSLALPGE